MASVRELVPTLDEWRGSDPRVAVATVVRTTGSTPRPAGARLIVHPDGRIAGSVSGGCLEAAVVEEARLTLDGTRPPRVLHYGISDEMGWSVGLSCGGTVDLFIEAIRWDDDAVLAAWRRAVDERRAVALCTVVDGELAGRRAALVEDEPLAGTLGNAEADEALLEPVAARFASGLAGVDVVGGLQVFVDPEVPAPHLAIVGAVDIAAALAAMAGVLGYRVTVVDPRSAFLTRERFPDGDLVGRWPDEGLPPLRLGPRDAIVCLSHDAKFDEPTLATALQTNVGYIGAIGSRRTHAKRVARLQEAGHTDDDIARVHSPVGLNIGARTPAEIALAIAAEMVGVRRGGSGGSMSSAPREVAAQAAG
jgi:xanthine dehydrogenase accessory factor